MKKKKKKIWLFVLLAFALIIVGVAGYIFYELKIKQYDVADPIVDEIIKEEFVIKLPDEQQLVIDKDGKIISKTSLEQVSFVPITETNNMSGSEEANSTVEDETIGSTTISNTGSSNLTNTQTSNKPREEKPTVESIKEKYVPTLEALEVQANAKINGLIEQAKKEYVSKKSSGKEISFGYFYNKYVGAASNLEVSTDAAFNSIMGIIEKDLEVNGYSKADAESFRAEYNAAKETRRNSIYNKALEFL